MNDLEDIFKSIIAYLMEELPVAGGGVISRLNYFINEKNVEKGDSLLDQVINDSSRFVLNQRMKDMKAFKNWIDIAVAEEADVNSNFDTVAKSYAVSIDSLLYDDLSEDTFYKSVRMAEVLKNVMVSYFKDNAPYGFMFGAIETNTLPDRVLVEGTKTLMSGITYMVTVQ